MLEVVRKYFAVSATLFMLFLLLGSQTLRAQYNAPNGSSSSGANWHSEDKGPTASALFSSSSNSISGMVKMDANLGWNFTKNFGVDVGVPYLFNTRPGIFAGTSNRIGYEEEPYVACTYFFGCYLGVANSNRIWTGEVADVYAELHYTRTYKRYNLLTNLTGDAPTASYRKGLTSGRAQWDWFNHIDTNLHGFDPFLNFGIANGRMDQHFMPRPYDTDLPFRTLGYMSDFEGGVQYKVWRRFDLGFSMWDVLPYGPLKIYSNLVWDKPGLSIINIGSPISVAAGPTTGPSLVNTTGTIGTFGYIAGDPNHGRYWNTAFETMGPSYIARDNGYSATLGVSPVKFMDILFAYNHSVRYGLDTVDVTVQFNANSLFWKIMNF